MNCRGRPQFQGSLSGVLPVLSSLLLLGAVHLGHCAGSELRTNLGPHAALPGINALLPSAKTVSTGSQLRGSAQPILRVSGVQPFTPAFVPAPVRVPTSAFSTAANNLPGIGVSASQTSVSAR